MDTSERVLNLRPSPADPRDFRVRLDLVTTPMSALPDKYDLHYKGIDPEIWDQGSEGSCTGHGGARAHEIERRKQGFLPRNPSRQFIYWNERNIEGTLAQDAGAEVKTALKVMADLGTTTEELFPYKAGDITTKPSPQAYTEAADHQITKYERVPNNVLAFCNMLVQDRPIVFGMSVFKGFMGPEAAKTGNVPLPATREASEGGHCVCATGYVITSRATPRAGWFGAWLDRFLGPRQDDGYLICDNSWGSGWGDNGRFYLPFEYMRRGYTFDAWAVEAVES